MKIIRSIQNETNNYSNRHSFSNIIFCGNCGKNYIGLLGKKKNNGSRSDRRWRCTIATNYGKEHETANGKEGCNNSSINEKVLKYTFLEILKLLFVDKKKIEYEKQKIEREKDKILNLCIKQIYMGTKTQDTVCPHCGCITKTKKDIKVRSIIRSYNSYLNS